MGISGAGRGRALVLLAVVGFVLASSIATSRPAAAQEVPSNNPVVGLTASGPGNGYWQVASDGGVFGFGDARSFGSAANIRLRQPMVGMERTPTGNGYWLVAADGGIFNYGDARFYGSAGGLRLNKPIVGMASTLSGKGYWLVAADGGIFAYGDAGFYGSTGNLRLNQPVVAMASTPSGSGYWLVAQDGGVFAFGDARYHGRAVYTLPAPTSGYHFILPKSSIQTTHWLTKPHHDYPAADIPVGQGTPYYAAISGTVTHASGDCGFGVTLQGDDGVRYTYCHGLEKGRIAHGVRVNGGQQLGVTGNSGRSYGAHLHFQIKNPTLRCPQQFLLALYNGSPPPAPSTLPTGGCSY